MPIRGSSWFAKRGGKRVRGGNQVDWAVEGEVQRAEHKVKREKRREM
jgi:hypothetical protein